MNTCNYSQRYRHFRGLAAIILVGVTLPSWVSPVAKATPNTPVPTAWHPIGPTINGSPVGDSSLLAGRVSATATIPGSPPTEVIGTLGGIWKRVGTNKWHDVTDPRWPSTAVNSIAVDPVNPKILYAGTGYDDVDDRSVQPGTGILKSTNGGQTWSPVTQSESLMRGFAVTGLFVDPKNHSIVVAAANNGVFRSVDSGKTWTLVLPLQSNPYDIVEVHMAVDPVGGTMLVGVAQSHGISANWHDGHITTGHAVFRSTDQGKTWTAFAVDATKGEGDVVVPAIATAKSGVTYTYAFDVTGGAGNGVYTSSNRGQSWKLKTSQDVTPKFSIAEMVVNPLSPTHAFFAQAEGPFEYTWGSSSVATVTSRDNSSPQFGDWRALSFGPAAHSTHALYGGTDGGPVAYNLNTRTYWNQSAGLIAGIDYYGAASSAKSEVSGAQDLGVDTYRGGPVHEVYHADAYGIVIDRSNSHIYYAGVNGPGGEGYQVSRDAGVSWKAVRLPGPAAGAPFGPRSEQATGDSKVIILPEPNSTLYITKNDGNSWSARTVGSLGSDGDYISSVRAATISGASVPVLYVGTAFGRLWKSTNLGANWTELSMQFGMTVKDIAIDAAHSSGPSAERVFVALGASAPEAYATSSIVGDVQETTDSGADWTDIGQSLQHISVNGLLLDSPNLLAATDYGVQVYSGGTWSKAGTGFPNVRVNDIFESWDHKAFFATTYGRGTWMSPAS